jgi:hypothetical protein
MSAGRVHVALLAGTSYALAAALLARVAGVRGSTGGLADASYTVSALSGLVAGWGAASHDRRRASRGDAPEPVASVIVGWTIALGADLLGAVILVGVIALLIARSGHLQITDY